MNESKAGFNAREYDEYLISVKDVNDVGRGEEIEDSFDELFLEFKAATVQGYKVYRSEVKSNVYDVSAPKGVSSLVISPSVWNSVNARNRSLRYERCHVAAGDDSILGTNRSPNRAL
ncbi:hypothetical protein HZH66_005178 [Vespula vulgaris]|uniref:Uncharacterized protein n=1 Tax=Vespula vulgaris TaxID=7454 RepID=A0A834KBW7_VESVU|nr:hypothetical protein HZH66_005178 [Vespula vulgaris]